MSHVFLYRLHMFLHSCNIVCVCTCYYNHWKCLWDKKCEYKAVWNLNALPTSSTPPPHTHTHRPPSRHSCLSDEKDPLTFVPLLERSTFNYVKCQRACTCRNTLDMICDVCVVAAESLVVTLVLIHKTRALFNLFRWIGLDSAIPNLVAMDWI